MRFVDEDGGRGVVNEASARAARFTACHLAVAESTEKRRQLFPSKVFGLGLETLQQLLVPAHLHNVTVFSYTIKHL